MNEDFLEKLQKAKTAIFLAGNRKKAIKINLLEKININKEEGFFLFD